MDKKLVDNKQKGNTKKALPHGNAFKYDQR